MHLFQRFAYWIVFLGLLGCGNKQPQVVQTVQIDPATSRAHLNLTSGCAECHEAERMPPQTELNITVPHGRGEDCSVCHTWPSYSKINASAAAHSPPPDVCMGCHSRAGEKTQHPKVHDQAYGECAKCHAFPKWTPTVTTK